MIQKVCVFCGSSTLAEEKYYKAAEETGFLLAQSHLTLIFGGGSKGLMGATAKAVLAKGGKVHGFIPHFLTEKEGLFKELTSLEVVNTMHIRKQKMSDLAEAFVILPGGFGTLDELFEIMTWRQLEIHKKPIVVINSEGYWDPLKALFESIIHNKFALPEHRQFMKFVPSPGEAIDYLLDWKSYSS